MCPILGALVPVFLADRFNKASCLFCRNSIKCETSSVKRDCPLSEVLLPITIMDLIGNWEFKKFSQVITIDWTDFYV